MDLRGNVTALLLHMKTAVSLYYNASATVQCYFNPSAPSSSPPPAILRPMLPSLALFSNTKDPASCSGTWDWQWCTEMTQPFSSGLGGDMFFPPNSFNLAAASDGCFITWGVRPRPHWATLAFGSKVFCDCVTTLASYVRSLAPH